MNNNKKFIFVITLFLFLRRVFQNYSRMKQLLFISLFIFSLNTFAQPQSKADKIELNNIKNFFSRLKSIDINTKEELLWTYTYMDTAETNLKRLADIFVRENLKVEGIEKSEKLTNRYLLHVSEVKKYTPEDLQKRMKILNQLADLYGIMYPDAQFAAENIKKSKEIKSYKKVR